MRRIFLVHLTGKGEMIPVTPQLVRFGLFELDLSAGELAKNGRRLKLQEQPFRLLTLLLEHPGQTVSRERLREALWPADTFVDFDHSLNAAVAKLRQALGDSAENPRFIETQARRGYRFIAPVDFSNGNRAAPPPRLAATIRVFPRRVFVLAGIAAVAALAAVGLWSRHIPPPGQTELVQLTNDAGLTMDPVISPDGKLLAYASDRADGRNLNIWVQQLLPGGTAVQLTHFDVETNQPSFSPDGSKIVFRSARDGGGIYVIPTIGGEANRLAAGGWNPRFSPDGRWIAFWAGFHSSSVLTGGEFGELYVVPSDGGQIRRIASDLHYAVNPVWSPDSKHLLAYVQWDSNPRDWYVVTIDGAPSRQTGIFRALERQGFSIGTNRLPRLSQWTNHSLIFSAIYGDGVNVWRMPISDEGHIAGRAERLTSGTTAEAEPLLTPAGGLIFASLNLVQSVWSLPADTDSGAVTGELKKITAETASAQPSISLDGRTLAFVVNVHAKAPPPASGEPSNFEVRVRDLLNRKEIVASSGERVAYFPRVSRDGTRIAYLTGNRRIYEGQTGSRPAEMISAASGVDDWSPDNKLLLFEREPPSIYVYDRSSRHDSLFLQKPGYALFQAKFSPDSRAVVLIGCHPEKTGEGCAIFIVPLKSDGTPETHDWIAIDHPSPWDDKPRWSPSGNLLYFVSDRDGSLCLWAQRLNSRSKQPEGVPFAVYHFHRSRLNMNNLGTVMVEIDVARDEIFLGLGELTGNIWSLKH